MRKQVVDLDHQRFKLKRYLIIQLRTLALLELEDLLANGFQRPKRPAHRNALQDQHQNQCGKPEPQTYLLHKAKACPDWRVILRNGD
ncbi:hypothetical protein KPSA1_02795 [Pseudomonas syringae pv. actinidiae]|uniref:Uncharacterized protein n=1 Tax=Pseudomonas syringae pv. actinidiae TaxID=103796 RepID=A0A2V0QLC1_PSESF|nr:hypothetical protein KPSA1_02795 [Pseudomonas syringae pv. actinidiae]